MKILLFGSNSVHVSSYISALDASQHDLYLVSEEKCSFAGIKQEFLVDFRKLQPQGILKNYKLLKKIIREVKPDVIHIHQVNRLAYFASKVASQLKIKVVTTAWGSDVLLVPKQNKFFRFLVKQSLKRSDFVTADARVMIDAMQALVPSGKKYVLLQYGIEPIQALEKEKIIYSNRFHNKIYRIEQIIRYFAAFYQAHPDWKLIIASTGTDTDRLERLANELKVTEPIEFVGWQNREANRAWYAKSSIYISIPESDGTSASVLESMSASCIPVLSDIPVSHEWIEHQVNGIIEENGQNPLIQALEIDVARCDAINQGLIQQKASRQACIAEFLKLYRA